MLRAAVTVWALGAGFAAVLAAQDRSPFFATVVGDDGEPVRDAAVTCVFSPDTVSVGAVDIVTATTDERGRARLSLMVGRLYIGWAIAPPDEQGTCMVTLPVPLVAAGRVLELRVANRMRIRTCRMVGLGPWREVGAAALRWFPDGEGDAFAGLDLPVGDDITLPVGPWTIGSLCVCDAAGQVMVATRVAPEATELPQFAEPLEIVATARDAVGTPLAGVRIEHFINRNAWRRMLLESGYRGIQRLRLAAVTGADGKATFHLPKPVGHSIGGQAVAGKRTLHATCDGFATQHVTVSESGEVAFQFKPRAPVRFRVVGSNVPAHLSATGSFAGAGMFGEYPLGVGPAKRTGGEAVWEVAAPERGFGPKFAVAGVIPTVVVLDWIPAPPAEVVVDLAALAPIDVRVVGPEGGPTAAAIAVGIVGSGSPIYWSSVLATDIGGRATVRMRPGKHYVYATTGTAHTLEIIDFDSKEPLQLTLEPIPIMTVQVEDSDGRPVRGARLQAVESSYHSPSQDERGKQLDRVAQHLSWSYAATARSDARGVLHAPALLRPGLTVKVKVFAAGRESEDFEIAPDTERRIVVR